MAAFKWRDGKRGRFKIKGKNLEWAVFGPQPEDRLTFVLLHEGLGCVALWKDFPEKLARATGASVFVYSRAGYGRSDPADLPREMDYMSHEALEVLPDVLERIGADRFVLVGHSDGASIAAVYAGDIADDRLQGLVLIAPHFFTEPEGLSAIAHARAIYERENLRDKLAKYHDDVDCAFYGWNDAWLNDDFLDWNIADSIDTWSVPVLAIQGADDAYGTVAQISEIEQRIASPLEVKMLDDCKHSPHIEKQETVVSAIETFCKQFIKRRTVILTLPNGNIPTVGCDPMAEPGSV